MSENNKINADLNEDSMSVEECEKALLELENELSDYRAANPVAEESEPTLSTASVFEPKEKDLKELDGEKSSDGDGSAFAFKISDLPEEDVQKTAEEEDETSSAVTCLDDNELFIAAARLVVEEGVVSTSFLQRRLLIGYGRAVEIVRRLEELAIISPADGNRARRVMVSPEKLEKILSKL
jgi:DNA segregation ATPase FtsK/SpoIIIE-like protein